MARAARALCLLLICVLAFVNVETRIRKRVTSSHHTYSVQHSSRNRHTASSHHVPPPKTEKKVHSYRSSERPSSARSHVPRAQQTTTRRPYINKPRIPARVPQPARTQSESASGAHLYYPSIIGSGAGSQPAYQQSGSTSGAHVYSPSISGSGAGNQPAYQQSGSTSGAHVYPPSISGSGAGSQPAYQQSGSTSGAHVYPPSISGSGAGNQPAYQQSGSTSGAHVYTPSISASGAGNKPAYQQPGSTSGAHVYPPSSGGSGAGYNPYLQHPHPGTGSYPHPPKFYPGNTGHNSYNNHIFFRNQHTTNVYVSNIRTTNIRHYHYNPPPQFHYSSYGSKPVYYPVYSGELPLYVYEYRTSRSRYNKLLAGLALYNLGLVSRKHQAQHYHYHYVPRNDEVCRFGVRYDYDMHRSEEMEVDCRLMTEFIWSESNQISQTAVIGNQFVLPNGTLVTQTANIDVANALDPRFNGDPIHVRSGMKCYMKWSVSFTYTRTRDVDCGLLQTYVDKSLNSAGRVTSAFLIVVASVTVLLVN